MKTSPPRGILMPIMIAGAITLAVTLLRLYGEIQGWSPAWFGSAAGGQGSLLGISWLAPVFGFWFGRRLAAADARPQRTGRAFVLTLLGLAILLGGGAVASDRFDGEEMRTVVYVMAVAAPLLSLLALAAWPSAFLATTLYGLLARIPVITVQYVAIANDWGTHYEKVHPKLPPMTADERAFGLMMAQLTVWIPFTILTGTLLALAGASTMRRRA